MRTFVAVICFYTMRDEVGNYRDITSVELVANEVEESEALKNIISRAKDIASLDGINKNHFFVRSFIEKIGGANESSS